GCGPARVLSSDVPSKQYGASRGWRCRTRQDDAPAGIQLRRVEASGNRASAHQTASGAGTSEARSVSGRQTGRRTVADSNRLDRRPAIDARLLSDTGTQHDPRRIVFVAPQHEPARKARLRVRGWIDLRHARVGRTIFGVG